MRKLGAVLALAGVLTLAGCGTEPKERTILVPDVLGGELLCTAIGDKLMKCRFLETKYPDPVDIPSETE